MGRSQLTTASQQASLHIRHYAQTTTRVRGAIIRPVNNGFLFISRFQDPTSQAIRRTPFTKTLQIIRWILMTHRINSTTRIQHRQFSTFNQVALSRMFQRPPTFNNTFRHITRTRSFTFHLDFSPRQATPHPLFTSSLGIVINRHNFRYSNNTKRHINQRTMALLSSSPRSVNSRTTTFPIRVNRVCQNSHNRRQRQHHRRARNNRNNHRRPSGSFRTFTPHTIRDGDEVT